MDGYDGFADVLAGEAITNLPLAPPVLSRSWRTSGPSQPRVGEDGGVGCRAAAS